MSNLQTDSRLQALAPQLSAGLLQLIDDEVDRLLSNRASLNIQVNRKQAVNGVPSKTTEWLELDSYAQRFQSAQSREEGTALLKILTKPYLERLARHYSVPLDSSLTKARLIERMVEMTIGLKLRQAAFASV
jgi:hypothetical protein